MKQQSFKSRIASVNTVAVAILMAIVFCVIYAVVYYTSYKHLDDDILTEKNEVLNNLDWEGDSLIVRKMPEWNEAEHKQMEANPTFLQLVSEKGKVLFKSDNLQGEHFLFNPNNDEDAFFNSIVNKQRLRLGQFPIKNEQEKIIGHLTIGVSQQESYVVLYNLFLILLVSYFILLLSLFAVLWYAASTAIRPVNDLIFSAASINESNLNQRLPMPTKRDEIWQLAKTFNELLDRLDASIQQQKQFTADVSHEMRTPLTAIKGTLEVLLRKQRSPEQYELKLHDLLQQTNRLAHLYDQMLELSKLETGGHPIHKKTIPLASLVTKISNEFLLDMQNKMQKLRVEVPDTAAVEADPTMLERIIANLLSNAIKYNKEGGEINIVWDQSRKQLSVSDEGVGIADEHLPFIFDRLYRTDASRSSTVQGNGIGLFIVKKLCDLQSILLSVKSQTQIGSSFQLRFP